MENGNRVNFATYIRVKRSLKWYKKLWNILTFNKEKNYEWKLLEVGLKSGDSNE